MIRYYFVFFLLLFTSIDLKAQPVFCPPNLDFETGTLNEWQFYTGSCCPLNAPVLSGPLVNRHEIATGVGTDPYGGFPVVAPGGGFYALKLGNDQGGSQAEKARYYVRIPNNLNNYGLIYRYAVVFQDPNHTLAEQPRFEVNVYDSATNAPINCNQFTYVAGSSLPGFQLAPTGSSVYFKDWTTGSLDFSGMAGRTIIVDFATGDCSLGAHFGYGYIDMTCGLFAISASACSTNPNTTLTGPFGFQSYDWWDATFTTLVGSGQTISIPTPPNNTGFNVILTPYAGFGCPDTLFTTVTVSNMTIDLVNNDTTICKGASVQLNTTVNTTFPPVAYNWSPIQGLSCLTCANPVATPTKNTKYYVTVTDSVGCTKTDSVQINVSPNIEKVVQNVSCAGAADGSIAITATGFAPFTYSWNTIPPQNTPNIGNLVPGTYIVTVSDNQACTNKDTTTITQPPVLNVALNNPVYSCTGADITAVASGGTAPYTYSWNTVPVQNTATVVGVGSGTYTVTATDKNGCTSQASVTISLSTVPLSATVSNIGFAGCSGPPTGTATVMPSGGAAPYTYSWNTVPPKNTATITGVPAGTYTVNITDAQNCVKTMQVTIPASDLDVTVSSATNVNCLGGADGTATATATGGTPGYTYQWTTTPPQAGPTATNLQPGTWTVIVTDANNCKDTNDILITQPATALATTMTVNNVACFGTSSGSATIIANGGTPPYSYSWNTVPVQNTATATNLPIGTYTATVTDANGCTSTKSATLSQPTDLVASITGSTTVSCFGGHDGTATATGSGGTPPYSYSWNTVPAQATATATGLAAGTYTATVTDSKGCSKNTTIIITQPAVGLSSVISSKTDVSCMGSSDGKATVTASGGTPPYSYSWNTSPAQSSATAFYLAYGIYDVTVTDSRGCTSLSTVSIGQPALLQVSADLLKNTCPGLSEGIIAAQATGGTPPYNYQWNTTPVQNTDTVKNLPAGTYTVTITDANSCVAYATVAVNNFELSVFAGNDTTICRGDSVLLRGTGSTVYNWAPPADINCSTCQNTFALPDSTTLYQLFGVDAFHNCPDTAEILVTVLQHSGGSVGPELKICDGDTARLSASGGGTYLWTSNNDLFTSSQASPLVVPRKDTRYEVIITENACFKDTLYQNVQVFPMPTVDLGPDIRAIAGEPVNLNATITNATKISWTPTDGLSCSTCQQPVATVQKTITYIAEVETSLGCKAVDSITINVGCDGSAFFIPNTFTPNGDGENDRFYPRGVDVKSINYFRIYNRWGEKVFEAENVPTNDASYGWDGTFRGRKVDPEVFVYILELNCANADPVVVKGDVSVMR